MSGRIIVPKHIDALDGLRAIAILLVLLVHCGLCYIVNSAPQVSLWQDIVVNGRAGVDLFFVLSGFLITGILLNTRDRSDYFPRFYWRRALRIWPVYYAFLLAALLIHPRVFSHVGFRSFALYYRNFLPDHPFADLYFGQFWSLCVEEQFYLVWPLILFFLPKRLRLPLIAALMVMAVMLRFTLLHHGMTEYMVYRLPFCRMDSLAAGAGIAVLIREAISNRVRRAIFWGAIASAVAIQMYVGRVGWAQNDHRFYTVGITAYALFFGGMVGLCVTAVRRTVLSSLLSAKFFRAIATRSYAMYLFHLVPLHLSVVFFRHIQDYPQQKWTGIGAFLVIAATAYGLAWLSWRFLEEPILRLKDWEWWIKRPLPIAVHSHSTE
jgi:peptidoglycan/LPS O-acetylase OafA/YrhL